MRSKYCLWAVVFFALAAPALAADHKASPAAKDEMVPLIENLGDHEFAVTTDKPLAQRYFNQGLRLIYAFNHDEAIRAFKAATKIDPNSAMAYWGVAISLGPNYNLEAEKERSAAAYQAVLEAKKRLAGASPKETAYIHALATRYSESPDAERKKLDRDYAAAMRKVAAQYPDDLDAAVLYAEALMDLRPWDLWTTDGHPQPGTPEIVATLERVLQRNPRHPGANHFYIHAVEASMTPERGLAAANRLGELMPGAGHLVHMPSHIFFRIGRYADAVESNRRAVDVDRAYIAKYKPEGVYTMMYYPHNIHFLWASLMMEGNSTDAIARGTEVVQALDDDMVKEMPMLEIFLPTRLYTLVRFGRWDDIVKEKAPAADFPFYTGMWQYAQGLAAAEQGRLSEAQERLSQLETNIESTPEDRLMMRHSARRLLQIAAHELGAKIASKDGRREASLGRLHEAVLLQDGLAYDEPPPWYHPMRRVLAVELLEANRPADAETVFREDLRRHPENGWSLHGLRKTLRALKRIEEADLVHERFKKAWARADHQLGE
jgi:tetratricopeptide (TPR) repeat protein